MNKRTLIFLLAIIALKPAFAHAADLTVEVSGIKAAKGMLKIAVYTTKADFLHNFQYSAQVPAALEGDQYVFTGLEPGPYAVAVYQDINGNNKLDKTAFGAPTEPIGMSRDARGSFGPPRYEDAVFTLGGQGEHVSIKLQD